MLDDIYNERNKFERLLLAKCMQLERAKANNEKVEELKARRQHLAELKESLMEYLNNIELLKTAVVSESNNFHNRRIGYLNDAITESLNEIFPTERFTASIECDYSRTQKAQLLLTDGDSHQRVPSVTEGKLMQYLISFSAVAGICRGLGVRNLFVDEAFGAASVDKLTEISDIFKKQIESGMQVVLIAQNPALYSSLPRREIHLEKDPLSGAISVKKVIDL